MKSILTVFLFIIGLFYSNAQTQQHEYPSTMPEFTFVKIKGDGVFSEKDIKKNKQTLIGIVSPECIHCVLSIEHLNNNFNQLENLNVIFVTEYEKDVFITKITSIAPKFLENNNVQILQDTEGEFIQKFKPLTLPSFYLYNSKGNLETVKRGSIEINQIFQHIK